MVGVIVALAALLGSGCTGGASAESNAQAGQPCASASGGNALCLVACNLGCTATGCSVTEIAVNQPIILTFNQDIDPRFVSSASVSMKTSDGKEPVGDLLVQGQTVFFVPEVRTIGNQTFFGFEQGRVYTLTLPGGATALSPLRSTSGDKLSRPLSCFLNVSLGVVDQDGKPPEVRLITPSQATQVPIDTSVVWSSAS
jgi:hypothetical protein